MAQTPQYRIVDPDKLLALAGGTKIDTKIRSAFVSATLAQKHGAHL
jgi:hypothetical protein